MIEVVLDGRGAANSKPFHIEVDPRSATVGLSGYYEADTWSLEVDTRVLPFDPEQIAYCAAHIYMWDAQKGEEQTEWAIDDNLMVRGIIDDGEGIFVGEDNYVTLTGRDYLGLLADPEWDSRRKIPAGDTLDVVVQAIADEAAPKGTRARFTVKWNGEHDPPIVGHLHRSSKKGGIHVKPGKNYWDVIWDLCIQHAYVPRVVGATIIIEEPVTQTKQTLTQAPRLIYGETLTKLESRRKFGHDKVPQVAIVAWDPSTGKEITVVYPEKRNKDVVVTAQRDQARDALGIPLTVKKDEVQYFPAPKGVTDKVALKRYARMMFYHLGRGETVYTIGTNHLWIPGPDGTEINVMALRPGHAIGVTFDPISQASLRQLEYGQRLERIIALGYHEDVAKFVAENIDRIDLYAQNYYHNRGNLTYGLDEGIEIEIEAANFASEVREVHFAETSGDATLPAPETLNIR